MRHTTSDVENAFFSDFEIGYLRAEMKDMNGIWMPMGVYVCLVL